MNNKQANFLFLLLPLTFSACTKTGNFNNTVTVTANDQAISSYIENGEQLRRQGLYDEAIIELNKAIALNSEVSGAYACLAAAYEAKGDLDKAIENYELTIKLQPDIFDLMSAHIASTYYNRGTNYLIVSSFDKAISDFNRAIELNKDNAHAYANRGHAYLGKEEFEKAKNDFLESLKLKPDNPYALSGLRQLQ